MRMRARMRASVVGRRSCVRVHAPFESKIGRPVLSYIKDCIVYALYVQVCIRMSENHNKVRLSIHMHCNVHKCTTWVLRCLFLHSHGSIFTRTVAALTILGLLVVVKSWEIGFDEDQLLNCSDDQSISQF